MRVAMILLGVLPGLGCVWSLPLIVVRAAGLAVVLAGLSLAVFVSRAGADEVCRKYVPSAGILIEVPCKPVAEPEPVAVIADTMERRTEHEFQGNSYQVLQLADTAACEQACLADTKCIAIEYYHKKSGCGLFDVLPPIKRAKFIAIAIRKRAPAAAQTERKSEAQAPAQGLAVGDAVRPKWCNEQPKFNDAEKLVCADAELSVLDLELESIFGAVAVATPAKAQKAKLQAAEDRWAEMRDQCQANRVCVKAAYQLRIEQLRKQLSEQRKP